jgi:hypothetical protein
MKEQAMTHYILVHPNQEQGYTATVLGWPLRAGTGPTRETALAAVQSALRDCLAAGELVPVQTEDLEAGSTGHPWLETVGMFDDNPLYDEVMADVAAAREREREEAAAQ